VKSYRRWFNENEKIALDVNTKYVLHEVSAPDGYDTAEDIVFSLNQYDSSLVFYEKVNGEWKESRMTAEYKLTMVDQKAGTHTYPHDNNHTKDHPHKPDDETKNHQTDHGTETPRPDKNKETVTKTSDSQEQPKETQSSTTVNTGVADNSAWLGLFVIAALGLAAVLLRKKRMN
jgi:LPXTG-motif cell wall-anchored protein